jgi:serine/threonine protein kinase
VDKRSDIWAFGCVFYEMLTRRRAFQGEGVSDTLANILTQEPDWNALPANTPTPIRTLLRRCLEKDRKRRLDSATAARLEIDDVLAAPFAQTPARAARPTRLAGAGLARAIPWTTRGVRGQPQWSAAGLRARPESARRGGGPRQ